jgi:hypothetical protein
MKAVLIALTGGACLWLSFYQEPRATGQQPARPEVSALPPRSVAVPNSVVVKDLSGRTQTDRPFSISRVFAEGEIPQYAKAVFDGQPVPSQCDTLTRWADGSLRHAIISFRATLRGGDSRTVQFVNAPSPCALASPQACENAALTQQEMLNFPVPWQAEIETTAGGAVNTAKARRMLSDGAWRYWLRGPIVTQVIVEDRSPALAYDWGYKDRSLTVQVGSVARTDTSIPVVDAAEIAQRLPASVQIEAEIITVCDVRANRLIVGVSSCPNADGRGVDGTAAAAHPYAAVVRLLGDTNNTNGSGWRERVVGMTPFNYQNGLNASATSMPIYTPEYLRGLPVPFTIQIDQEQLSVCRVVYGQPGTLTFGQSQCPGSDGRGVNNTTAAFHKDNTPIYAAPWTSSWVQATDDRYKSLHPIFVLTFYNGWDGVKAEYILENAWTTRLQDQHYSLVVRNGGGDQFSGPAYHRAQTRWRKVYWDGTNPGALNIDFNLPYLVESRALPSYDLSVKVASAAVQADIRRYELSAKGAINDLGLVVPYMPNAGGRGDIGLFPRWDMVYLYSSDPTLYEAVVNQGHVAAGVPLHFRESAPNLKFDSLGTVSGFGRPVSADGRPGFISRTIDSGGNLLQPVGLTSNLPRQNASSRRIDNWNIDTAHQPNLLYVPYLLTGDWFFLEELYFWAAYNITNSTSGNCDFCRHDDWGFLNESSTETRGLAWALRSVAHAAFFAPTGSPEQAYFNEKLENNIAVREGAMNIQNGAFYDPSHPESKWSWGRRVVMRDVANPLRMLRRGLGIAASSGYVNTSMACFMESGWQLDFNYIVWGHMEELGFTKIGALRREAMIQLLQRILDPAFSPKSLLASGYFATRGPCSSPTPFRTWDEVVAAFAPGEIQAAQRRWNAGAADLELGYPTTALASSSFLPGIDDGDMRGIDAWNWMKANVANQRFQNNPKWALVPRSLNSAANAGDNVAAERFRKRGRSPK